MLCCKPTRTCQPKNADADNIEIKRCGLNATICYKSRNLALLKCHSSQCTIEINTKSAKSPHTKIFFNLDFIHFIQCCEVEYGLGEVSFGWNNWYLTVRYTVGPRYSGVVGHPTFLL